MYLFRPCAWCAWATGKRGEHGMNRFQHMTAKAMVTRSRPALLVRKDTPRSGFAASGIALQRDRRFVVGHAI
jgi:hypothetical protein